MKKIYKKKRKKLIQIKSITCYILKTVNISYVATWRVVKDNLEFLHLCPKGSAFCVVHADFMRDLPYTRVSCEPVLNRKTIILVKTWSSSQQ